MGQLSKSMKYHLILGGEQKKATEGSWDLLNRNTDHPVKIRVCLKYISATLPFAILYFTGHNRDLYEFLFQ